MDSTPTEASLFSIEPVDSSAANMPFGGVRIVSDNSAEYPEQVLTATERVDQDFQVYGWVWQIARIEKW